MKIGFRLDANEKIATGHMMRCMAIALQCRRKGVECCFFLAQDKNTEVLLKNGFEYIAVKGHWNDWNQDIDLVLGYFDNYSIDLLVVDSYQTTEYFLEKVNSVIPTVYLDDFCVNKYKVTGIVNYVSDQNIQTLQVLYKNTDVKIIAGTQYVPLREEFSEKSNIDKRVNNKKILLTTGGSDPFHISYEVTKQFIEDEELSEYGLLVILGKMNHDEEILKDLLCNNQRVQVEKNVNDMARCMQECCVAVSAGGSTIFELCAVQTPTVCFSFTDDQLIYTDLLSRQGTLIYSGDARKKSNLVEDIIGNIKMVLQDRILYEQLQSKMAKTTDGQGAMRIAEKLIELIWDREN